MALSDRYEFSINRNGKRYACSRTVEGIRGQRQQVTVRGVGSKDDSAEYGTERRHPQSKMELTARLIDHEIFKDNGVAKVTVTQHAKSHSHHRPPAEAGAHPR